MGKSAGKKKKKKHTGATASNTSSNPGSSPRAFDADMAIFIDMSHQLKEEGIRLFQKRDYEGAILKYEKAVKLLPKAHEDAAPLRSYLAACYMQMEPADHHRAIDQCNLALEVIPKYSKALLKRARCYETLDRLDLAMKDVDTVLGSEPNNITALEISERVRSGIEKKGIRLDDRAAVSLVPELTLVKEKEKPRKKKSHKTEDKAVVKEESADDAKVEAMKVVKLVFGEDIRWAQLPSSCDILRLREIVRNRFPSVKAVLIKYKDSEGDLVTITTSEELRWAEDSADPQGSLRLYITEVNPEHDPLFSTTAKGKNGSKVQNQEGSQNGISENGSVKNEEDKGSSCIEDWMVQFAQLFKSHVGFNSDAYLDIHELGMKLYSEAIEDTVTTEEAQDIFETAAEKFQELAALALFNWGNVHMSRARKRLFLSEDASRESVLAQVKTVYEWVQRECDEARKRYEEALKIKPDFYEGLLTLAQQQFEQAKLSWYYAVGSKIDLEKWPSSEVLELFKNAEDNMERGNQMWEEMEEQRLKGLSEPNKEKTLLQKMGLDGLFKELSTDEAAEQASSMRSQINLLWGTMLYERSVVEFKLKLPIWEECLVAAVEKFKLAGASPSDLAAMKNNHCSNETTQEGLGFKIDDIVRAWNEMYDVKRSASGVPSFRLEPLFRRRVPKLHQFLEHI